jgi:hypothetical protein
MTRDELNEILGGEELTGTLDVRTLVLDIFREMPESDLLAIFWEKLPSLSVDYVRDYLYMRRG